MLQGARRRIDLPTSASLLVRLREQDSQGWESFVTLYAPLLACWCTRQGLSEHDAADVAQEVFGKVAASIALFRKDTPDDSFRGWICRITHHAIVDFRRRRDQTPVGAGGTEAHLRLERTADRPLLESNEQEQSAETCYLYQQAMKVAQSEFSERMWQMFWRVAVDGNSAAAVAIEFGATPGTVRQAKWRVLRRLKQIVGDVAD